MDAPGSLLRRYRLLPKRSWGQNFLGDPNILARIAEACALIAGDTAVELGAGLGHLTDQLLATGAKVVAVERDREMAAVLREVFPDQPRLTIVEANAATCDIRELAGGPCVVVGNLPYHLSSEIIFHCLAQRADIKRMVFTLQAEFAERLAAGPGSRTYGILSVQAQSTCEVRLLFRVAAGAFHPKPEVDSAVVSLVPLAAPRTALAGTPLFERTVRAAFGHRRKTLQNSLTGSGMKGVKEALAAAGIDPTRRAETVSVEEFGKLATELAQQQ
jgi:16S rRNA (adenine1518-N6/adenine1519-N6)-dimethyltransferase